jgi:hypothetical protein
VIPDAWQKRTLLPEPVAILVLLPRAAERAASNGSMCEEKKNEGIYPYEQDLSPVPPKSAESQN